MPTSEPAPRPPAAPSSPEPDAPCVDAPPAAVAPAVVLRPSATVRAVTAPRRAELAAGSRLIEVVRWDDPLLDQFGHDPRSPYVERFWLGVLGPSATWLLRSLAHRFDDEPEGFTLDLTETARALGIGARGGANGPFFRTLERVISFGFARCTGPSTLEVRRRMAPLNRRQQQRLPRARQIEHEAWVATHPPTATPSQDDLRRRARALALSLLELGEDPDATEQQLHRWRFHPAIAFDSVRWAETVHEHRRAEAASRPWPPVAPGDTATADPPPPLGGDAA
jgi:hypothetical protein